ncbi:TonB-dependent receptor [soil metagenome]
MALCAGSALAQTAPATAPVSQASADAGEISEIVVTATRRSENLQNVPQAVTAVTGETLAKRGVSDMSKLDKFVPGFSFGQTGSDVRPAMRGVRTANNGVTGDPTIGYFIDGIYQSRTSQAALGFVDVGQLEVQRGPQGTLYGRNTFGGNITVTTNAPKHEYDYGGTLTAGNYDKHRFEGFLNLPITDNLAGRISVAYDKADGYVKNSYNSSADLFDTDSQYIRGALKYDNEKFSATLRADHAKQGGNGNSAFGYKQIGSYIDPGSCQVLFNATVIYLNERAGNRDGVADCTSTVATPTVPAGTGIDLGIPIDKLGKEYEVTNDYRPHRDLSQDSTSLDMSYDLGPVTVKSISGFVHYRGGRTTDSDFSSSSIAVDYSGTKADTISEEVQILSSDKDAPFQYVIGGYFLNDDLVNVFINQQLPRTIRSSALSAPITGAANNGTYSYEHVKVYSRAAYAQGTYHFTDKFSLIGGARYTHERKTYRTATAFWYLPKATPGGPNPLTLVTVNDPLPPSSLFPAQPTNCGTAGVTAATVLDSAGNFVDATYCPLTFSQVTWKVGAEYKLTEQNLIYATVSTGFRSGGFNGGLAAAQSAPTFNPEKVKAYEVGSKNRFFDNSVQLNVSAFYNDYKDLQEQRQVIVGGTTLQTTFNAATARSYGLETEAIWQPTPQWNIGATLSLLSAKYKSFKDVPLPFGASILVNDATQLTPTIVNGITIAGIGQRRIIAPGYACKPVTGTGGAGQPALAFGCDLSGNHIPHSPAYSGSLYASRSFATSKGTVTPFAAVVFAGSHHEQSFNDKLAKEEAWAKLDASVTWDYSETASIEAYVDNATNTKVQTLVSYGGTPEQASYEPPRMYGVRLRFRH